MAVEVGNVNRSVILLLRSGLVSQEDDVLSRAMKRPIECSETSEVRHEDDSTIAMMFNDDSATVGCGRGGCASPHFILPTAFTSDGWTH